VAISIDRAIALPEGPTRTAAVAAWIQSLYTVDPPILVGGAAVELYTGGAYTTGDLDFVGGVSPEAAMALENAGFRREGRHWIHDRGGIFVEFPGSAVERHERVVVVKVGDASVLALSPEDMIVDRLAAWQFWKSATDGASGYLVWRAQEKSLDQRRLSELARRRGLERALDRLKDLVSAKEVSAEELEKWAERKP
jgi:hypothetical protein